MGVFLYILSLKNTYLLLLLPLNKDILTISTHCQSIVVLGGRDDYDRILKGLELSQHNPKVPLIFSGVHQKYNAIVSSFELKQVVFEKDATNTYENGKYSSSLLKEHNISSTCLVTSEAHLYRASNIFKNFNINTILIASNKVSTHIGLMNLLPDLKYFVLNISVIYEYMAIFSYRSKGMI